jgi:hypothetical protein
MFSGLNKEIMFWGNNVFVYDNLYKINGEFQVQTILQNNILLELKNS